MTARGTLKYCAAAARGRNLRNAMRWVTCTAAAAGGHLDALRWSRECHCPWVRRTSASPLGVVICRVAAGVTCGVPRCAGKHKAYIWIISPSRNAAID